MVKPNYTPIKDLTDQSRNVKVKVKVISKGDPKQTPPKRRYQKLLLKDDEGTAIDGAIFGDDIEAFEQAIMKNGEYELSNLVVKPVPDSYRARSAGDYQINFNSNVRITPLDLSGCSSGPEYRRLDKIPRTHSAEDDLIDTIVVVLYVGQIKIIKSNEIEERVRDIVVVDQSCDIRPVKISAWNQLAVEDLQLYKIWAEGFVVVGFRRLQPITYRGLALKTGPSTQFVEDPTDEIAAALRQWVIQKKQLLEDWRAKAMQVYDLTAGKIPTPLSAMERKKANTIWQDEKFWIQVVMSALEAREIHCYIGCNKCGKSCNDNLDTKFVCSNCHAKDAVAIRRGLMNVNVYDKTGSLKISAFQEEVELIVGLKLAQIAVLKHSDNADHLARKISELKNKEMLLQIIPTNTLFQNNVLKWVVRAVEVPPEKE